MPSAFIEETNLGAALHAAVAIEAETASADASNAAKVIRSISP